MLPEDHRAAETKEVSQAEASEEAEAAAGEIGVAKGVFFQKNL